MNVQDNRIMCAIWKYYKDISNDIQKKNNNYDNYDLYRLLSYSLIQISEQVEKLSLELISKIDSSLIKGILGIKDLLMNGLSSINESSLYITIKNSLPKLMEELNKYGYYDLVESMLHKPVLVEIDRPIGYDHNGIIYELNYGYTKRLVSPDGDYLDAYIIDDDFYSSSYFGEVIAIVHRKNDIEDKLIVGKKGQTISKEDLLKKINFQEKYFDIELIM